MTYGTYSFTDTLCTLMGVVQMNNPLTSIILSEDGVAVEGIVLEPKENRNYLYIGADGTPIHALSENRSAILTINLLKTNPRNAVLQDMFNLQTAVQVLHGQNIVILQHSGMQDTIICNEVAFQRAPKISYSQTGEILSWVFDVGICLMRLGEMQYN